MKHSELIKRVAGATGYEEDEVALVLKTAIAHIGSALLNNEEVKLSGLGTLFWQHHIASQRRHPQTGQEVRLPERWVLKFRPITPLKYMEVFNGEAGSGSGSGEGEGG